MKLFRSRITIALWASLLAACSGDSGDNSPAPPGTPPPPPPPVVSVECTGQCANASTRLSTGRIEQVIAQAASEASARGSPATIAVVDRVGNVLAVFKMNDSVDTVTITSGRGVVGGLEGIAVIPAELAAIAKAITGAFLSSEGNAFTTRTASQIIQEHFNPMEFNAPGGPLFGVQFSQLPCSDLNNRFTGGSAAGPGPQRSPLGLSADPGGLPLYLDGTPVGGIGVVADAFYSLDPIVTDIDLDLDEAIAMAGAFGLAAPVDRQANRITVDGKTLRFADIGSNQLVSNPATAPPFASIDGSLRAVTAYTDGSIRAGTAFGQPASGIRPDLFDYPGQDAFVLVDAGNVERFRPRAGTDGAAALTATEVQTLVTEALRVANRARGQIRRPLSSQARVSISVVDSNGVILAIARTRDAPIFGIDVGLQKARTAAFFSNAAAADELQSAPNATYRNPDASLSGVEIVIGDYVAAVRALLGNDTALADGAVAFSDRAGGNLSRPYFPDGIIDAMPGPFSKPFAQWSPFSDGLQLDLVFNRVVEHVLHVATAGGMPDPPQNCTTLDSLPNGTQIFPGSVPIYRDAVLVGGIGVSGDGVDQDDMIAFLGLHNAAQLLGTINNAAPAMRADTLTPQGVRLRFVQCPQAPFIDSNEQSVCAGK